MLTKTTPPLRDGPDATLPKHTMDIVDNLMQYEFSAVLGMHGAMAFDKSKTTPVRAESLLEQAAEAEPSQAMHLIARVIRSRQAAGHKRIAVFCHLVAVHKILIRYLEDKDVGDVFFYDSSISDSKTRDDLVRDFKSCEKGLIFLTKAGGVGITLSPGCQVMLSVGPLPWNSTDMDQAFGRVYRIGQENPVEIIQFVARRSVTASKLTLHADKRDRLGKSAMDLDFSNFDEGDVWRKTNGILEPCARLDKCGNYKLLPEQVTALRAYQERLAQHNNAPLSEAPARPANWPLTPVLASRMILPEVSFALKADASS